MAEKVVKEFSQEEKNKIENIQTKVLQITARLGEIEIDVNTLETQFSNLKDEKINLMKSYSELRVEEQTLAGELREKYGEGTYDITTNQFTPNK
jgi:chromosome segregation ATPase|tara:strand:- start:8017 stop:8298 length:282 start_codon:yes stop_codon:yes gene_type:complete